MKITKSEDSAFVALLKERDNLKERVSELVIAQKTAIESLVAHRDEICALNNAPWLSLAHTICTDCGIEQGHIEERLKHLQIALKSSLADVVRTITTEVRRITAEQIISEIERELVGNPTEKIVYLLAVEKVEAWKSRYGVE